MSALTAGNLNFSFPFGNKETGFTAGAFEVFSDVSILILLTEKADFFGKGGCKFLIAVQFLTAFIVIF